MDVNITDSNLSWSLAVATYRRPEMLRRCVLLAATQTCAPYEIIVVDASDDWKTQRDALQHQLADIEWSGRLVYVAADTRSATAQRNQAIQLAHADVLFVIDDDSLLYPTAAERVMQVYESDTQRQIVGVAPQLASNAPDRSPVTKSLERPHRIAWSALAGRLNPLIKGEFYPPWQRRRSSPLPAISLPISPMVQFQGARMTARREAITECLFDEAIRINYHDDSEICWRLADRGLLVELQEPLIYHAEADRPDLGQRRNYRTRAAWVLNHAYLCRKLFGDEIWTRWHVYRYAWGTVLLDSLQGLRNGDFTGARGALYAAKRVARFFQGTADQAAELLRRESDVLIQRRETT
jgi:glycosyltransferase involved in cell wall biosynthesis